MFVHARDMVITSERRSLIMDADTKAPKKTWRNLQMRIFRALF
jgi:hypothetical protein